MSEATISFTDHDLIRTLFGAGDQYLRQVRDSVGIDVVVRGDELRLHGEADSIQRGLKVFQELQQIIEQTGRLQPWEVEHVLGGNGSAGPTQESESSGRDDGAHTPIDLFEKAKRVAPRTRGQAEYVKTIAENDLVFCTGPAGCGKTYLAVAMAVNALRSEQVRKIVLVRPAVEAGEKLGFLPGDMLAKVNPYLRPLLDSLNDILDFEQVKRYMARDVIEIVPLAFMRGRTLNNTFIILDEAQNTTVTQMKMFLTRMGQESKIVVTGDTTQIDLPAHVTSGLIDAVTRLGEIEGVGTVKLTGRDIVRHRLVREVVRAYDDERDRKPRRK
jgi:phosphate starvation-inducible PhoH-like protein